MAMHGAVPSVKVLKRSLLSEMHFCPGAGAGASTAMLCAASVSYQAPVSDDHFF